MNKRPLRVLAACGITLAWASLCAAAGGRVAYPDGTPVVGAAVNVHMQDVDKFQLETDANGRFTLPAVDFLDAFVQITAPDGKNFASVSLPVKVFEAGELAVVLQPKK